MCAHDHSLVLNDSLSPSPWPLQESVFVGQSWTVPQLHCVCMINVHSNNMLVRPQANQGHLCQGCVHWLSFEIPSRHPHHTTEIKGRLLQCHLQALGPNSDHLHFVFGQSVVHICSLFFFWSTTGLDWFPQGISASAHPQVHLTWENLRCVIAVRPHLTCYPG